MKAKVMMCFISELLTLKFSPSYLIGRRGLNCLSLFVPTPLSTRKMPYSFFLMDKIIYILQLSKSEMGSHIFEMNQLKTAFSNALSPAKFNFHLQHNIMFLQYHSIVIVTNSNRMPKVNRILLPCKCFQIQFVLWKDVFCILSHNIDIRVHFCSLRGGEFLVDKYKLSP